MRTTVGDVLLIMGSPDIDKIAVASMITAANAVVNSVFLDDTSVTATLLTEIEKWLTAHMVSITIFRSTSQEKIADAMVIYTGKFGLHLDSTPYGQMVKIIDVSGKMSRLGKIHASVFAVETDSFE